MKIIESNTKSILTKTRGFLYSFTHTINPYLGCQLGLSLCGNYCYAKALNPNLDAKEWGRYIIAKVNAPMLYKKEYAKYDKLEIFMASVTDPYPPIEFRYKITRKILEAMIEYPPDRLVIQTHTPNILRDISLLKELNKLCRLSIHITVETDMENESLAKRYKDRLKHMYTIASRLDALKKFKDAGIRAVATISPLMPLEDPTKFAKKIDHAANYVILDHFILGDGSNGMRTSSYKYFNKPLPIMLYNNGYAEWITLDKFYEIVDIFREVLGYDRVGISKEGFNSNAFIDYEL
jgi:DNA repair photolyase